MSGVMSVVFVTEASPDVGLGHLRRCQALATALRRCGATRLRYRGARDTRFLLGPEYALLDPAFGEAPDRVAAEAVRRVLVTLGGGLVGEPLAPVIAAVRSALPSATIDLALGPLSDDDAGAQEGVTLHRGLCSLHGLMLRSDLAVTGGGMTVYECLAAGTPVVGVCLADNQRPNIDALSRAGLIVSAEPSLEDAIRDLATDSALRRRVSGEGRRAGDGRGAERVADEIVRLCVAAAVPRGTR